MQTYQSNSNSDSYSLSWKGSEVHFEGKDFLVLNSGRSLDRKLLFCLYLLYMATRWRNFTTNGPILKACMSPLCMNCMYVFKQYRKATILKTSFFSKLEKWLALRVLHCSGGLAAEVLTQKHKIWSYLLL